MKAYLGMAVDARSYFPQSLPIGYVGNLSMLNQSSMPLSPLTSSTSSLVSVAHKLRVGASAISSHSLLDAYF
jgi:hypothetical protein